LKRKGEKLKVERPLSNRNAGVCALRSYTGRPKEKNPKRTNQFERDDWFELVLEPAHTCKTRYVIVTSHQHQFRVFRTYHLGLNTWLSDTVIFTSLAVLRDVLEPVAALQGGQGGPVPPKM